MVSDYDKFKIFGKNVITINEKNEIRMELIGRVTVALFVTFSCLLVYFLSFILFKIFSDTFKKLPKKEKMFWNLAVVRGVYGLIGTLLSIHERYFDTELAVNIAYSKTVLSYIVVHSHLGFFIFEWSAQIFFDVYFKTFSKALQLHHVVSISGYILASTQDCGHYLACSGFILEMSTPFSCICYCLIKSKMSETIIWKINQLILVHVFHLRSVLEFILMYEIYKQWEYCKTLSVIWNINLIGGLVLFGFILTPYWTYRKTEQLFLKSDWSAVDKKKNKSHFEFS